MSAFDVEREAVALCHDDDAMGLFLLDGIRPEHFFDSECRAVFSWCMDYYIMHGKMQHAPSEQVITSRFPRYPEIRAGCGSAEPSYVAQALKDKHARIVLEDTLHKAVPMLGSSPLEAANALLETSSVVLGTSRRRSESLVYGHDHDLQAMLYKRRHADGNAVGAPFPIVELQEWTSGIRLGEIWPLVADTGIGKTWFCCAMALSAAKAGWNVYFAELEMDVIEIAERIDVIAAKTVSAEHYDRGEITAEEARAIEAARKEVASYPGKIVIESPARSERSVEGILSRALLHDAGLVIVDQLQLMKRPRGLSSRTEQIEEIVQTMKDAICASGQRKHAVLMPVQFNRERKKAGTKNTLGDLHYIGLSASIEQIADGVISLGRTNEMESIGQMMMGLLKFRRGPKNRWLLNWRLDKGFEMSVIQEVSGDEPEPDMPF